MSGSGIAVKAFILNGKGELLLIRREKSDPHNPGTWEVPGGRLGLGENPFEGLKREAKEETGLDIVIGNPIKVHHFTRDDGQRITMITFLCKPLSETVSLGREHTEFAWLGLGESLHRL